MVVCLWVTYRDFLSVYYLNQLQGMGSLALIRHYSHNDSVSVWWSFHRWSKWGSENEMPPQDTELVNVKQSLTQDDIFLKPIFTSLGNSELRAWWNKGVLSTICLICCPTYWPANIYVSCYLCFTMLSGSGWGMKNPRILREDNKTRDTKGIFTVTVHK